VCGVIDSAAARGAADPAWTPGSLTKSRLALSPRPSKVAPLCPPRSESRSYASAG